MQFQNIVSSHVNQILDNEIEKMTKFYTEEKLDSLYRSALAKKIEDHITKLLAAK